MKTILITFLLSITLLFFVLPMAEVKTQSLQDEIQQQNQALASKKGANFGEAKDIRLIIALVIKVAISFLGTVFLIYTVYGGALIMLSAGEEDRITKGKNIIRNGVIGIFLILSSYGIAWLVYSLMFSALFNPFSSFSFFGQREDTSGFYNSDPLQQDTVPFRAW